MPARATGRMQLDRRHSHHLAAQAAAGERNQSAVGDVYALQPRIDQTTQSTHGQTVRSLACFAGSSASLLMMSATGWRCSNATTRSCQSVSVQRTDDEARYVARWDLDGVSGVVVAVDVLRAFTTAAYAFAAGAASIWLVGTVDEALTLGRALPGSLVMGEVHGRRPPGFDLSNSPVDISHADVEHHIEPQGPTRFAIEFLGF